MLLASVCCGDLLVTATATQSLTKDDELPVHYTLTFTDTVTGTSQALAYEGENELLLAVAAWINSDEPWVAVAPPYRKLLDKLGPSGRRRFLP